MQKEIKIGIGAAVILILIFLGISFLRLQTKLSPEFSPPPTPSPEIPAQQQLEAIENYFGSGPDQEPEAKSEELVSKVPSSLQPLVEKIKQIVEISELEKVEYKDGKIGYRASFTTQKSVRDISSPFIRLIITEGFSSPKAAYTSKAFFLESENVKLGFRVEIEATEENSIVKGTITFTPMK